MTTPSTPRTTSITRFLTNKSATTRIRIETQTPYDVVIGSGILDGVGSAFLHACPRAKTAAIVSDDDVAPLYMNRVEESLASCGIASVHFTFPHGEAQKSIDTWQDIMRFLAQNDITRTDAVIALGGGVVGDMAGFAAATYMRGIDVVQVPTSLLADIDSSVGGKTAVDLPEGKNLVGAFWQPRLVWMDIDCLSTLPRDFQIDGMGEVLKCGVLQGGRLFEIAERNRPEDRLELISACIRLKDHYISEDEKESGSRRYLNLGHTFGHAVETIEGFTLSHGACVSIGLTLMARACERLSIAKTGTTNRIVHAASAIGLPTDVPASTAVTPEQLVDVAQHDKKRTGDHITVITVRDIGSCALTTLSYDELLDFARAALSKEPCP